LETSADAASEIPYQDNEFKIKTLEKSLFFGLFVPLGSLKLYLTQTVNEYF
jgi:hypothetical protein